MNIPSIGNAFFGVSEQFLRLRNRINILLKNKKIDIVFIHDDISEIRSIMTYFDEHSPENISAYQNCNLSEIGNNHFDHNLINILLEVNTVEESDLLKSVSKNGRKFFFTRTKKSAEEIKSFFDQANKDRGIDKSIYIINVPSINDRSSDIPIVIFNELNQKGNRRVIQVPQFSSNAMIQIMQIKWKNTTHLCEFVNYLREQGHADIDEITEEMCKKVGVRTKPFETPCSLKKVLPYYTEEQKFEENYLKRLLSQASGKVIEAAKISGIQRQNLYRLFKRNDIKPEDYRRSK